MTETPQDKGYFGEDAEDLGNAADERDVQTAPAGTEAANVGTAFEPTGEGEEPPPYTTTAPQ